MGRYADPQLIVDKRFEKVRGELDKLYKNVDNNLQLIAKRKQARKTAQAKKYGKFGDVYNNAVKDSRASSRKFARTRPDMAKDAKKQFSDQIASRFDEGYDNIQAFVRGQYISKEGEEPIKNQIDAANDLGESLVAFEALSNEHAKGIKAGDRSNGKNAGSVVVGSEFSNIFNAMTGDTEGQDEIQWSKMKLSGSLTGGTTIYFDGQSKGEEGFDIADPDTEVIDLSKMKTNYFNGKEEAYFQKIKKKSDVTDDMRTPIKTLQDNKAVNLFEMYNTVDKNGNPMKMKVLNQKKTQDYFITGKGAAVTIDAMIEKHGGIEAAVQAYFGADVAANEVWDKPGTKEYDQAMLKLKTRLYEDLDPLISDGDKDMLAPNKETTSRQFTKDTSSKVVKGFYEEVHGEVNRLLPTLPNDKEAMNEFNLYIQNRPYSQGGKTYTIDHMEPITKGSSDMVLVMKDGNKIKPEEGYFTLKDKSARRKLEQGLMKGNFQGTTDRKHVDGYYNSKDFGGEVEETYNGAEKESVRITSTQTKGGISYEEYMQKVEGSEKPLNSNTIDWPWETEGLGAGSQAAALDNVTPLNQTTQPQATTAQPQDDNMGVNYAGGTENPDLSVGGSMFNLSAPDGSALNFKSTDAKSQLLEEKDDGKDLLRKIGNFEALAGSPSGKGLSNYGMGTKYQDQVKSAGLDPSTEEGLMYALETVAKGNAINEMNLPKPADFDRLDETLKASIIDWEYNTGRDVGDIIHAAQMMKDDSWKKDIDLGGMTVTQLVNARGSKKVNVKIGDKTYKTAAEAMKAIKADDSPVSVELTELTAQELADAKHAVMSDKTSRTPADIATYNKTWKYRIDQLK